MSNIQNGGPAFGRVVSRTQSQLHTNLQDSCTFIDTVGGMTLRDWFAGQALVGLLSGTRVSACRAGDYAQDAFIFADAMLKAREEVHGAIGGGK